MQKRHTQILLLDRGPLGAKHRARTRDIVTLATSGRNFDDSDSETDENASTSLLEESQESGVESDSDAASELAIFQVSFFCLVLI